MNRQFENALTILSEYRDLDYLADPDARDVAQAIWTALDHLVLKICEDDPEAADAYNHAMHNEQDGDNG